MNPILLRLAPYAIGLIAIAGGYMYAYFQGKGACQSETATQTIEKIQESRTIERGLQSAVSEIDAHQTRIKELENENANLRRSVDSGSKRLYVAAKCPAPVPSTAGSASVDNGPRPELDAEARQDYFDLRSGIEYQREQLTACQAVLIEERKFFNKKGEL